MGAEIFPTYDKPCRDADFDHDGKHLMAEFGKLDRICREAGLREFSSFGNSPEVPVDFEGDLEDIEDLMEANETYFSIDEGLKTVEGLLDAIAKGGGSTGKLVDPPRISEDLRVLHRCLTTAQAAGCRFRFDYAY